jgi:citrate/tricarballylate utilization protein
MPSVDLVKEAERQLTVCNACRYCEGYCAVFPAMEQRRTFVPADIIYMANLCFECRACYYACPYTPPHEYAINLPEALSAVRVETYADYTGPRVLSRLFQGNGLLIGLTVGVLIALIFGSVLLAQGADVIFEANSAEGAFFEVVPYYAMVLPALALSGFFVVAFAFGALRFWRETSAKPGELIDLRSFLKASKDAFGLEYLRGGGQGCNYPDARFSQSRRYFHQLVLYGFLLDLASTTVAAIYHNFLDRHSPYPYLSLPVVLGTVGGLMIVVGVLGMFWLKSKQDLAPAHRPMLAIDVAFLWILLATSVSGLALLVLRESSLMGTLLTVHLGIVAAFFLTLPFGKFAHVVYRYAALIRYQVEQRHNA